MDDDYNSLWTVKESNRESVKTYCNECVMKIMRSAAEIL
jgi:hypothetical protein